MRWAFSILCMYIRITTKPGNKYRSIQNRRMYRALRKQGYSKEAAARISNAQTPGHTVKAESEPGQLCPYCTADLALPDEGWYRCGHCGETFYASETDSDYEDYHAYRMERIPKGTPPQPQAMPTARVLHMPRREKASDFTVFKDARGEWRWLAQTTTAFEDRDREVLSLKALEADVARADADGKYGPLRWWHIGAPDSTNIDAPWGAGLDLGWCDFNAIHGHTLIESGTFKTEAIARWAAANADSLGLSPGFFHPATEPDPSGVFHHIRRFERSLAPKERVSNPFTSFSLTRATRKETTSVDKAKIQALVNSGIDLETIADLLAQTGQTEKTAMDAGVRFKEVTPSTAPQEIVINGVTYTAKAAEPVLATEPAPSTESEPQPATPTVETPEVMDLDLTAFRNELRAAVKDELAPLVAQLDATTKEWRAALTGVATKEVQQQAQTAVQQEITSLKARLAELEGDRTALQNGHVASTANATVTNKAAELAVESQPRPLNELEETLAWTRQAIPQAVSGFVPPSTT